MESIAFALPLKPGKFDELRSSIKELTGPRGKEYHTTRQQRGLTSLKVWHQKTPQEMLIVYLEADSLEEFAIKRSLSGHHLDDWLEKRIEEIVGAHRPHTEMVLDWHTEAGHRLKHDNKSK